MEPVYITLTGVIALLITIFGIKVYSADKKNLVNKSFALFTFISATWLISDFLAYQTSLADFQLIINRIIFAIICFLVLTLAWFVYLFPRPIFKIPVIIQYIVLILGSFIGIFALLTGLIVKNVTIESWGSNLVLGNYFLIFAIYVSVLAIFPVIILIIKLIKFKNIEKTQIKYFSYGIASFAVLNLLFNMIIPSITKTFEFGRFGTYSTIIFIGFTAYAILKAHLFNIKVILTETAVVIINIILAVQIFSSVTIIEGLLRTVFLAIVVYGSLLLLKSVRNEIKQKEDLQKLSKKLDEANQHLEELDEAKDNFLSMAAHELNTPIAAIEGYLSMIIDEKMAGELNPKATGYLQNIFISSKRLAGLVKDLLNVSRIESNRVHLIYTEEHIEAVIDQSITEVKIKADEVGHKLIFEKPKTALPKTWFDVDRITEVVINMIGNAIKYTEPPGKIVVSAHTDGDKIVIAIEDNGRGIPKDKYDHVFEKFVQVNVLTDQVKGTGLGMFISKNLIEMHKGKVWFKSSVDEKDHGTTFYFSLPILKEKPFDPHQGEGALFQTGSTSQKRIADVTDKQITPDTAKPDQNAKPETNSKPEEAPKTDEAVKPEADAKTTDPTAIPAEVKEEKDSKATRKDPATKSD